MKKVAAEKKTVLVHVPRLPGVKEEQQVIRVGHNFKNYCIRRGTDVMVPAGVAKRIKQHMLAEEYADREAVRLTSQFGETS